MAPVPCHQKIIGVKQAADPNRNVRHAPSHYGAKETAEHRSGHGDQRALPQEDRADVDPPVTHRAQNRDLFYLREHRHRQHIKNAESSQQDDKRNRNRDGHS